MESDLKWIVKGTFLFHTYIDKDDEEDEDDDRRRKSAINTINPSREIRVALLPAHTCTQIHVHADTHTHTHTHTYIYIYI